MTKAVRRHFPYKHPTFGTRRNPKSKSAIESSPYYWWWAYLRCNEEYLKVCANGGKGKLAALYKDFGDVRGDDFKAWWTDGERGSRLFAEPVADSVRVLNEGERAASSKKAITLHLPKNLPKRHLEQRVRALLAKHHPGRRGVVAARNANGIYRVSKQPNVPALKQGLEVWIYKKNHPDKKLWEIAAAFPKIMRAQQIRKSDHKHLVREKRIALASAISRMLARTEKSIRETSQGSFP